MRTKRGLTTMTIDDDGIIIGGEEEVEDGLPFDDEEETSSVPHVPPVPDEDLPPYIPKKDEDDAEGDRGDY